MRKGQIWTLDMALSLMIFFSALLSIIMAWNFISADIFEGQEMREMQLKTMTVSDSLIRTPGVPENWTNDTVSVIGLAYDDNELDIQKVGEFANMSYSRSRALLDVMPYNFYFEVRDINGTLYMNTSNPIGDDASVVIPAIRYASFGGRIVKVTFVMWI